MERIMLIVLPTLSFPQRKMIAETARKHEFTAVFAESIQDAASSISKAEIILGGASELADNAPELKWFCATSAGINQFREAKVFQKQALLSNSSGAYGVTLAEHIVMLTLEMLRRQPEYTEIVRQKRWKRDLPVRSIFGSNITILGTGNLAREAAIRLRAFSPETINGVNRSGRNPDGLFDYVVSQEHIEKFLPDTDILIITLPGTDNTFHMMNERRLRLLHDGTLIVNVGRGSVLEESALEKELKAGRLSAALDVFEQEPLSAGSPLWNCPNLLITPHVAGNLTLPYTQEAVIHLFLRDFENYCANRPLERLTNIQEGY